MRFRDLRSVVFRQRRPGIQNNGSPATSWPTQSGTILLAAIAAFSLFPATASLSQQDEVPLREKAALPPLNPLANPKPDANRFMEYEMQRQQMRKRVEDLNVLRQKEMTADTAKLLQLAGEVKIETNTAGADTLSVLELRKVEAIEKLAHGVSEKMKITVN